MICDCGKDEVSRAILEATGDEEVPYIWWLLCDICAVSQPGRVFTLAEYRDWLRNRDTETSAQKEEG